MSRPITDIIREINRGKFAEEITAALAELVPACRDAGAVGEVTISLKLKPGRAGSNVVEIIPSHKIKMPKREVPTEVFFATAGGALVRSNPDQATLELVDALASRGPALVVTQPGQVPVREVIDRATGEILTVAPQATPGSPAA